jgi:hypothetical protein
MSSRKSNGPRATPPVCTTGVPAPCASDDAENAFIRGNRALTICVFKSLDYVNSPQLKQNISQFEPADVVFSTYSPCELPA